jgi:hypothetical protein
MSSQSWIPLKDQDLLPFVTNFSAKLTASATSYGLVAADATNLATLVTTFTSTLAAATNPPTRTKTSVAAKNVAKAQLVADMRILARRIQSNPAVTVPQKTDLGLPIHQTVPTPKPAPSTKPVVNISAKGIRNMTLRLSDELTPTKKAKPPGAYGCEIYSYVSTSTTTELPTDLTQWRFEGVATKFEFEVDYTGDDVGKTANIVARWLGSKGDPGPTSAPISGMIAA